MKPPKIDCPKCRGSGKIALHPAQFQALAALQHKKRATAVELWMNSDRKATPTAWNNRLEGLVKLGLVKREGWNPVIYSISP